MNTSQTGPGAGLEALLNDLEAFRRAGEANPDDHLAPYQCGLILSRLGDPAAAVESYRQAVQREPRFAPAHYNMALAYAEQGLLDEAEEAYRQAIHIQDDPEAWANLGALYERRNRTSDAEAAYRQAVRLDPAELEARWRLGRLLLQRNAFAEAEAVFQEALDRDGALVEAWNGLGLAAYHQGRDEEARGLYLKAIEIDARFAQAWNNLGNLFARQGREREALEAYRGAAERDAGDPDIWFNLGEFYFRHDHQEAEKCLARVVELDRDDVEAWELLRQWYARHPNHERWKSVLRILRAHRPDDPDLQRELSHVLEQLGEHAEALELLRQLLERDPDDEQTRRLAATLCMRQGQLLDAYRHLGLLQAVGPEVIDLWYHLGQRLLHRGRQDPAEACFLTVVAHRPEKSDCWQTLGELALQRSQWELALERLERAEALNRNNARVWLPLAEQFHRLREHEKAARCLDMLADHLRYLPERWGQFFPIYEAAGRGEAFLKKLEALLQLEHLARRYWLNLAELYTQAGRSEDARRCLERAGETGDAAPHRDLMLGRYYLQKRDGAQALAYLKGIEAGQANSADYWIDRGDAAYLVGDAPEAVAAYERALVLRPEAFRACFNLGNLHFRDGRLPEAQAAFRRALAIDEAEPKAWYNLGCAQEAAGDGAGARQSFRRALGLHRRFAQAWNWLGIYHYREGALEPARRAWLRCLVCDPDSANGWYNLGILFERLGEAEKSARCLEQAEKRGGARAGEGMASVRVFFDRDPRIP